MDKTIQDTVLLLVRIGIKGKPAGFQLTITESSSVDWVAIQALATQHGLSAVMLDGIEKLTDQQRPPNRCQGSVASA